MSSTISKADEAPQHTPPTSPNVTYDGKTYNIASEGTAEILDLDRPEDAVPGQKGVTKPQSVFYNPVQQYNRDLSVLAIRAFGDDYVVAQNARRQKKANRPVKGEQQGKKRKREQPEGEEDEGNSETKKKKIQTPVDGTSNEAHVAPIESNAGDAAKASGFGAEGAAPELNGQQEISDGMAISEVGGEGTSEQANGTSTNAKEAEDENIPTKQMPFRILDALSATGLRALRYAKEIPITTSVTANDLSAPATASIELNVRHNELSDKIIPTTCDAIQHMHEVASRATGTPNAYHVIDLDPYGTAAPFLNAAVLALVDGGLLCVTCTDAGVFASVGYLEKTYSQYGGLPLKGPHAHEAGLRLILHAIGTSAARYGLAIEPLLSLSIDFYARVFVRIHRSQAEVKFLASKTMIVYSCDSGCGAWSTHHLARAKAKTAKNGDTFYSFTSALAPSAGPHCEHCGFKTHQAGPMWGGHLHNPHFIQRILEMLPSLDKEIYGTIPRMEGMLNIALNESLDNAVSGCAPCSCSPDRPVPPTHPATHSHYPFFFLPSALSRIIHCVSPSDAAIRGALLRLGYRTTRSHTKAGSICTDAPWSVIWEIMREWVRQKSPIKEDAVKKKTAGWGIMQKDRSKRNLNVVKGALKSAAENAELDEVGVLKMHIEAALYSLSANEDDRYLHNGFNSGTEEEGESAARTLPIPMDIHPSKLKVVFDEELGKEPQGKRMLNYQINPRPDWGPMNRAKGV